MLTGAAVLVITIPYKAHPKQALFHASAAKYRLLATGVGFGKTAAGANELFRACVKSKSCMYFIAAPTYKMLKNVSWLEFKKWCPREAIESENASDMIIYLKNGVSVIGIAGDREDTIDRARGLNLAGGWADEIARSSEYMHQVLVARIRDPNGTGQIWYTTTYKGRNWLFRLFELKQTPDGKPLTDPENYEKFSGTSYDNPYTPEAYKKSLENTYVGVFKKQEIYGEAVGFEGLVYPDFSRNVHVVDVQELMAQGLVFKDVEIGVDYGWTNPSAMAKFGFDNDGRAYIFEEFYESHVTDAALAKWAKENWGADNRYIADSAQPGSIRLFRDEGLSCMGVVKRRNEVEKSFILSGIMAVAQRLMIQGDGKPRLFVDKRCVNTIMEFESYRYPEKKEGLNLEEAPLKVFDHIMDVCRYVLGGNKSSGEMFVLEDPTNISGLF